MNLGPTEIILVLLLALLLVPSYFLGRGATQTESSGTRVACILGMVFAFFLMPVTIVTSVIGLVRGSVLKSRALAAGATPTSATPRAGEAWVRG